MIYSIGGEIAIAEVQAAGIDDPLDEIADAG
jgi:hypothetical protein